MIQRDYDQTNFITGMRAIAILFVFLIHSGGAGISELGTSGHFLVSIGRYGVQLFFVISGFTIFYQLFEKQYPLRSFWLIRLARISLPYFPIIILVYLYLRFGGKSFCGWTNLLADGHVTKENVLAHLTYLSAYFLEYQNTIIGVEWTLAIEVFFYLLFGLLIKLRVIKLNIGSFIFWFVFFFAISLLLPEIGKKYSLSSLYIKWLPFSYGYMFLLGGFSYYLRNIWMDTVRDDAAKKRASDLVLLLIVVVLIFSVIFVNYWEIKEKTIELAFVYLTFFVLIFFDQSGNYSKVLTNRLLLFLGSISYSFYLIHFLVIQNAPQIQNQQIKFTFELIVTIFISVIWYLIFEKTAYAKVKSIIKKMA